MTGRNKNKAETVVSDNTEDNTEQLAREECARLLRQLRLMENDKRAYLEESNARISRQEKTIASIQRENAVLEKELEKNRGKKEAKEAVQDREILRLVEEYKKLEEEVTSTSRLASEVSRKVKLTGNRIDKAKNALGKTEALTKVKQPEDLPLGELERKLFTVNKKLEAVTAQYDGLVAENATLRAGIDQILSENLMVSRKSAELDEAVEAGKNTIDQLMDQATLAYDEREESVAKINGLLERDAKERRQFLSETSELDRILQHEEKLLSFIASKNRERSFIETDMERISRIELDRAEELDEVLEKYRACFNRLLLGGRDPETELEALPEEFAELTRRNIAQFNHINELNNEVEALTKVLEELRSEINRCSFETVERNQAKHAIMHLKQTELEELKRTFEISKGQLDNLLSEIDEIVAFLQRLFRITESDEGEAPILQLLGRREEISEENAYLYLSILEDRIREIFMVKGPSPLSANLPSSTGTSLENLKMPTGNVLLPKPRIVISASDNFDDGELQVELFSDEANPLGYSAMRDRLVESRASSRPPTPVSSLSGDFESELQHRRSSSLK